MRKPYWVDANVFIQSANGLLSFTRAPRFWAELAKHISSRNICTSEMVYKELVGFGDELSNWVATRKQNLCRSADEAVQLELKKVVDYVANCTNQRSGKKRYDAANENEFFSGADPWLIAHVLKHGGTLVTNESRVHPDAKKVRIPDICTPLKARCIDLIAMMDELDIKL